MDIHKYLVLIKGEDKTEILWNYEKKDNCILLNYKNSSKSYLCSKKDFEFYKNPIKLDTEMQEKIFKEKFQDNIVDVIKFDKYYKIFFKDKTSIVIPENNLDQYSLSSNKFEYFKEISKIVSVKTEDGIGLLTKEYEKINFIEKDTALYKYLNPMYKNSDIVNKNLDKIIFPFGANKSQFEAVNNEYPIIFSTTYSIKNSLDKNHKYDYIIMDESSQVDLITGVLALSTAKNAVIVGDLKQLPNVITTDDKNSIEEISKRYKIDPSYNYLQHSFLDSVKETITNTPKTLLKEHYRCHPKIIQFCNKKIYDDQLIIMTEDSGEEDVLKVYVTTEGNHARGHLNQRQIDVIKN